MRDLHRIFTQFKQDFPEVYAKYEELGREVHREAGPLPDRTRWLLKVAISAAAGHQRALETHLERAREAGVTAEEIQQALLLLIPTCGFPAFMEAYSTFRNQP